LRQPHDSGSCIRAASRPRCAGSARRGYLSFYFARSDHAFRHRPELRANITRLPSDYLRMPYLDTCVHASQPIEHLVKNFGSDHVLLGTDYPYDMGVTYPLALLDGALELTAGDREKIAGDNARRLPGLEG